ncbi:hypothetical protein HOE04_05555 [archaeon]|jgi:hypothetical protein|nr:hypothetical protein [archaeon]
MDKGGYIRLDDIGMYFLGFILIGGAVASGIFIFYGYSVDVRGLEVGILSDKLVRTVVVDENIREEVFEKNFNILDEAKLNENFKNGDYFFRLEVGSEIFVEGNRDFEVECELEGKNFPRCFSKEFFIDDTKIKILTASRQVGSKV